MKTTLTVDENGILTFPDELLEVTGWKEDDVLQWISNDDGSFTLVKKENSVTNFSGLKSIDLKLLKSAYFLTIPKKPFKDFLHKR